MSVNIFNDSQEKGLIKLVIFIVNKQQFALPLDVVERAIQIVELRELLDSPRYVCGIINMHGEVVSVINLRALFGLPRKEMELSDQLLIVSMSKLKMALWIDSVQDTIEINESSIVRSEEIKFGKKCVQGVIKLEDGMILLNDVEKFLDNKELEELGKALQSVEKEKKSI